MSEDFSNFSGRDWAEKLSYRPELAKYCDWTLLDHYEWESLLEKQPHFEVYKDKYYRFHKPVCRCSHVVNGNRNYSDRDFFIY